MRHIGLFAGIGGFELAARWMGWNTIAWSEWDPFCQKVLSYHFPEAKGYGDIKQADFTQYRGQCDILTGGFPCQPYSVAGKRLGKEDERHLWPEMLRVIREVRPRWIVGENVRGLLSWNEGVVFEEVCSDLESEGYEVQAFIIPAAGVGAPHRRDRIWFVAHANNAGTKLGLRDFEQRQKVNKRREGQPQFESWTCSYNGFAIDSNNNRSSNGFREIQEADGEISERYDNAKPCDSSNGIIANASDCRCGGRACEQCANRCSGERLTTNAENSRLSTCDEVSRQEQFRRRDERAIFSKHWENFPTISPVCGGDDGLPSELDGITFPKWRKESIKAYGNAIVPQVAYQLFQVIKNTKSLAF